MNDEQQDYRAVCDQIQRDWRVMAEISHDAFHLEAFPPIKSWNESQQNAGAPIQVELKETRKRNFFIFADGQLKGGLWVEFIESTVSIRRSKIAERLMRIKSVVAMTKYQSCEFSASVPAVIDLPQGDLHVAAQIMIELAGQSYCVLALLNRKHQDERIRSLLHDISNSQNPRVLDDHCQRLNVAGQFSWIGVVRSRQRESRY